MPTLKECLKRESKPEAILTAELESPYLLVFQSARLAGRRAHIVMARVERHSWSATAAAPMTLAPSNIHLHGHYVLNENQPNFFNSWVISVWSQSSQVWPLLLFMGFPPVIEGSFQPQDMAEDTNQDLVKGGWGTIACNSSNPLDI